MEPMKQSAKFASQTALAELADTLRGDAPVPARTASRDQPRQKGMHPASPYLTTFEAAAYTHTSAKTLRRAELAGELQAFKPGKEKLYRTSDLDQWVVTKKVAAYVDERLHGARLSDLLKVRVEQVSSVFAGPSHDR
jgi:excisionase family DNA binding protein